MKQEEIKQAIEAVFWELRLLDVLTQARVYEEEEKAKLLDGLPPMEKGLRSAVAPNERLNIPLSLHWVWGTGKRYREKEMWLELDKEGNRAVVLCPLEEYIDRRGKFVKTKKRIENPTNEHIKEAYEWLLKLESILQAGEAINEV